MAEASRSPLVPPDAAHHARDWQGYASGFFKQMCTVLEIALDDARTDIRHLPVPRTTEPENGAINVPEETCHGSREYCVFWLLLCAYCVCLIVFDLVNSLKLIQLEKAESLLTRLTI